MPINPQFSIDLFTTAPSGSVPLALLSTPMPDLTYTNILETDVALNESPLDPTVEYVENFRFVREFLGTRASHNIVVNPMLQYTNPNNIALNQMPPDWTLVSSGETSGSRWKFVPFRIDPSSNPSGVFPRDQVIETAQNGQPFTVFFPNGYRFYYQANQPAPISDTTIAGKTNNVLLNEPYVLEVYYTYHPMPPFAVSGSVHPSDTGFIDQSEMLVTVDGVDSSGTVTETVLTARTRQRRQHESQIGHTNLIVRAFNPDAYVSGPSGIALMDRVRRWVCSSDIVFTNTNTQRARLTFRFKNVPGLAIMAVVMYRRSSIGVFRWDAKGMMERMRRTYPSYAFAPKSSWNSSYPATIGSLPHAAPFYNLILPSTVQAGIDIRRISGVSGSTLTVASYLSSSSRFVSALGPVYGPHVILAIGRLLGYPPTQKPSNPGNASSLAQESCYVLLDRYSVPSGGPNVLSYPYTGSYNTVPREITGGATVSTWRLAASRQYANKIEILTDDIPIIRNRNYRFFSPTYSMSDAALSMHSATTAAVDSSVAPYVIRESLQLGFQANDLNSFRYVAVGYDKDGNVTELAYLSPHPAPSLKRGNAYVKFTNPNTTKARFGLVFMQPYVHPGDVGLSAPASEPRLVLTAPQECVFLSPIIVADYWKDGLLPQPSDANFIPSGTADFLTSGWTFGGNVTQHSGNEAPGYQGYIRINGQGSAIFRSSWTQSNDQFLFVAFRIRYRVTSSAKKFLFDFDVTWYRGTQIVDTCKAYWEKTAPDSNWYDEIVVAPFFAHLEGQPYPDSVSVSLMQANNVTVEIGYFNVALVDDPSSTNVVVRRVSEGIKPVVKLSTVRKQPRVIGLTEVNRFHWAAKIRPGIAYVPYTVPSSEVAHSFVRQAGFSPGDQLVLVYTLPEYSWSRPGGVPSYYRRESVIVEGGVIKVDDPIDNLRPITVTLDNGAVLSGPFGVERFGRTITLTGAYSGYSGTAEVLYAAFTPYYIYTGCFYEDGNELKSAAFNLSPYGTETGIMSGPFINGILREDNTVSISIGRPYRQRIGTYIYLMPFRAIPKADFDAGDRTGVRLPNGNYRGSYVRHGLGYFTVQTGVHYFRRTTDNGTFSMAAFPLAWCVHIPPLGIGYIDLLDLRSRGGGVVEGYSPEEPGAYWDMSDWDGGLASSGGKAIVRLPASLLSPAPDRDAFTHEQILEIIRRYLPAGIDYEVEYVS